VLSRSLCRLLVLLGLLSCSRFENPLVRLQASVLGLEDGGVQYDGFRCEWDDVPGGGA
jgi:hypothetical protein